MAWTRGLCCWLLLSIPLWGQARIVLVGSGSSLAGPLLQIWEKEFNRQRDALQVTYVATSSAEGIRAMTQHVGDFAIGEVPLTREQMRDPDLKLAQIPVAIVAVVPIYNLPGITHLRFTGGLLAQIFMGNVSNWNDRRIAMLNPGVLLPRLRIVVVHRPEGGGTRYVWTDFLSQSSPEFRAWIEVPQNRGWGKTTAPKSRNMVQRVAATPGAIGYVERGFAIGAGLAYGSVQNLSGRFVDASKASVSAASEAKRRLTSKVAGQCRRRGFLPLSQFCLGLCAGLGVDSGTRGRSAGVPLMVSARRPASNGGADLFSAAK